MSVPLRDPEVKPAPAPELPLCPHCAEEQAVCFAVVVSGTAKHYYNARGLFDERIDDGIDFLYKLRSGRKAVLRCAWCNKIRRDVIYDMDADQVRAAPPL